MEMILRIDSYWVKETTDSRIVSFWANGFKQLVYISTLSDYVRVYIMRLGEKIQAIHLQLLKVISEKI